MPGETVFIFCIDFKRLRDMAAYRNKNFDSSYLLQFITAAIDLGMLIQSTLVYAQNLGLGAWITNEIYHHRGEAVFKELNIPKEYVFPLGAVCFGYRKTPKGPKKERLPRKFIFHKNQYQSLTDTDKEEILQFYDSGSSGLISNWSDKGFDHYLDWFFEKWSPAIGSRSQGKALLKQLNASLML